MNLEQSKNNVPEKIITNESVQEEVPIGVVNEEKIRDNVSDKKARESETNKRIEELEFDLKNKLKGQEKKADIWENLKNPIEVEIGGGFDDDSVFISKISIDEDGMTYGDSNLNQEQITLKLNEAKEALINLQNKKSKLETTNKLLYSLKNAFTNKGEIDFNVNKHIYEEATQGLSRLKKRIKYLQARISK